MMRPPGGSSRRFWRRWPPVNEPSCGEDQERNMIERGANPQEDIYGRMIVAADDRELETVEEVAERAGIIWRCGLPDLETYDCDCGWFNREAGSTWGTWGRTPPKREETDG